MRHVENHPGDDYVFVGGNTLQIPRNIPKEAAAIFLKSTANQDVIDGWAKALESATDPQLRKKLQGFGINGDVVYMTQVRDDGIASLSFYAGPARRK